MTTNTRPTAIELTNLALHVLTIALVGVFTLGALVDVAAKLA